MNFFGLNNEYKSLLHSQLIDIAFHSRGGISYDTVYSWPIWKRILAVKSLELLIEKENKALNPNNSNTAKDIKSVPKPPKFKM